MKTTFLIFLYGGLKFMIFKYDLGCSFRKIKKTLAKKWLFLTIGTVNKVIKCKIKLCRQPWS